jgi:hypothetical protein
VLLQARSTKRFGADGAIWFLSQRAVSGKEYNQLATTYELLNFHNPGKTQFFNLRQKQPVPTKSVYRPRFTSIKTTFVRPAFQQSDKSMCSNICSVCAQFPFQFLFCASVTNVQPSAAIMCEQELRRGAKPSIKVPFCTVNLCKNLI